MTRGHIEQIGHKHMIDVPEPAQRRTDRRTCDSCEASASDCRSVEWLRSRLCCSACPGDHDTDRGTPDAA